ncbi:MAG: translation initiation factor IF-1 [Candidatus Wildermuthbacteria bacterium RIFCSPHIGHO2_01_FULL_48_25]|uniref:Translation initiation factor IF-1 n=1 Tax=Candidatus Wildermuthbacteria bacterium RIFCSPLOWO2_01_FULL_48_16 TaxID=1802461 RepID=A0A1G2RMD9_9BACT|nr:MAG: translation initiation factor IF-1 [Candidatus Wildermuthbacteria bacterium RIFCSPHIGHO2_01_FULL_48_25]OHA68845.1 MAG: translation initiation factor IF-1 [Candidatus Wildermuthbacteria bacterium RIFCSPHIGHO2_02_FULL_49_12b]OHA73452.1 MAG: translation initiation factor IF-1 [Candidatus Wildermuthbacteria bacterium RIFCSPLOWO2_01_FULL_48_16]
MKEPKNAALVKQGEVRENLPSLKFKVRLDDGKEILAYLSGKLVIHRIRILPGDKVTVEMSPYDETKGRIIYRNKQ